MPTAAAWNFVVSRANPRLSRVEFPVQPDEPLGPGEVEFEVERFALSANNLTYAASGDSLGYWSLFSAPGGWGVVPAWGYAVARRSSCEHLPVNSRVFGLVPMGSRFRLRPRRVRLGLLDQSPQRQDLNPAYNLYADAPAGDLIEDELVAALRPLAILGFVLADHLTNADPGPAQCVVITSASSRTAISLGWCWHPRTAFQGKGHFAISPDMPAHGRDRRPVRGITLNHNVAVGRSWRNATWRSGWSTVPRRPQVGAVEQHLRHRRSAAGAVDLAPDPEALRPTAGADRD